MKKIQGQEIVAVDTSGPGNVIDLMEALQHTRCSEADERCMKMQPPLVEAAKAHYVKCWRYTDCHKHAGEV